MTALIWFRDDLRIADNPALNAAAESGKNVIALYILEDHFNWSVQGAAKWWLHHSLTALKEELQTKYNLPLTILRGNSVEVLPRFCEQHHISEIFWNRRYSEEQRANDPNQHAPPDCPSKRRSGTVRSHHQSGRNQEHRQRKSGTGKNTARATASETRSLIELFFFASFATLRATSCAPHLARHMRQGRVRSKD